jgi:hypothetical protein
MAERTREDHVMAEEEPHLTRTEARAGSSNHMTRIVLPISLALIVILFAVLLIVWR